MDSVYRKAQMVQMKEITQEVQARVDSLRNDKADSKQILDYLESVEAEYKNRHSRLTDAPDLSEVKQADVFAEDDRIAIIPMTEKHRDFYLRVCEPWLHAAEHPTIADTICSAAWATVVKPQTFYCVIEDKESGPVGYISIKDTESSLWEIAIEFETPFCHKGYGSRALPLFAKRLSEISGMREYQCLVEIENSASQGLMDKIGAKLAGIGGGAFVSEERSARYESENMDLVTEQMRTFAEKIGIPAQKLLTHVLDYRYYV